ncbi:cytidylate kinase [Candidatus Nitrososphaera evergladensis SR1]|uniref:Cytidylate kinase n=1 Tax=Candidatus Nitrososphaera evergladensis SR1 TaxID=1459636 RepID=A0A075MVV1_9ARCH|nr:AAA family ATPase [Candidatus Nitrososphaera evergladensis]AIF85380.1 cytidylate kinase [Candidatus Nitrososphaera evergladensis SR1]
MKPLILAFAGRIGSGKSTLSKEISEKMKWRRISFGDYVRSVASDRNLDHSRETLQQLGEALIVELGWKPFCKAVLDFGNWDPSEPLIVDGVRHLEALNAIKDIVYPARVALIFITLPEAERLERIERRDGVGRVGLTAVDSHSTESQVGFQLVELADLKVDGSTPVDKLVAQVTSFLQTV